MGSVIGVELGDKNKTCPMAVLYELLRGAGGFEPTGLAFDGLITKPLSDSSSQR